MTMTFFFETLRGKQEGVEWKQNFLGSWISKPINRARREMIIMVWPCKN
jgi:hypothetical protein